MYVASLLIKTSEDMLLYVAREVKEKKLAEVPDVGLENSFVCVAEAKTKKALKEIVAQIKAMDGVEEVRVVFSAGDKELDDILQLEDDED